MAQSKINKNISSWRKRILRIVLRILFGGLCLILCVFAFSIVIMYVKTPNMDGNWELGQERLAYIILKNDGKVEIENMRDFAWMADTLKTLVHYGTENFNIGDLKGFSVVESHFSPNNDIAHIFLVFHLDDGRDVGVSMESRREVGEGFSLFGGLIAQYELMYVVARGRDLLGLRRVRHERMEIYDINVTPKQTQTLFKALISDINEAHRLPKFYHLLTRNCTNEITRTVRRLNPEYHFSFITTTFAPGNVGKMLTEMGVVRSHKSVE
jgi:hypothetical protein